MVRFNRFFKGEDTSQDGFKEDLACIIARWIGKKEQLDTEILGLSFHRYNKPTEPLSAMYELSVCMTVQGSKRVPPVHGTVCGPSANRRNYADYDPDCCG